MLTGTCLHKAPNLCAMLLQHWEGGTCCIVVPALVVSSQHTDVEAWPGLQSVAEGVSLLHMATEQPALMPKSPHCALLDQFQRRMLCWLSAQSMWGRCCQANGGRLPTQQARWVVSSTWAVHLAWLHPKLFHEQQITWVARRKADLCLHNETSILSAPSRAHCNDVSLRPAGLTVRGPKLREVGPTSPWLTP